MDVSQLWSFLFFFMMINLALSSICRQVFKILQHEYIQYIYIYSLQRCPDLHGLHAGREARVDAAPSQDPHRLQRGLLPPGSAHVLEGVEQTSNSPSILTFYMLQGGIHLFKVFDSRCSSSLLLLSLIEVDFFIILITNFTHFLFTIEFTTR